MTVFDAAWGANGDHYKACGVHGSCMQCEIEELQDKISSMSLEMAELRGEVKEARDAAGRFVRGDAGRGDEVGDSKAGSR
jgi:ferredoxin